MKTIKCPKCKNVNVQIVNQNTRVSLNLNPFHPFTIFNRKPKGKTQFMCMNCGRVFEKKL
jgi:hypothetical protein